MGAAVGSYKGEAGDRTLPLMTAHVAGNKNVSGHDKITALLLYICDCVLLKKRKLIYQKYL
jgi:hypothetical protein